MAPPRLILASASPRRRQLLEQLGLSFGVEASAIDESPHPGERPERYVLRVAAQKAERIAGRSPGSLVLSADTTVVLAGRIYGKPADAQEARRMLRDLSGQSHQVLTGVAIRGAAQDQAVVSTRVELRELSAQEIDWYVATGEPLDKAGAYAIQGIAGAFVRAVEGSVSNVIGLPLCETLELLGRCGLSLPWRST